MDTIIGVRAALVFGDDRMDVNDRLRWERSKGCDRVTVGNGMLSVGGCLLGNVRGIASGMLRGHE